MFEKPNIEESSDLSGPHNPTTPPLPFLPDLDYGYARGGHLTKL